MPKLYFRYGTMGSSKTLNLLAVAHNYRATGMRPFIVSPAVDTRGGIGVVSSRAGLETRADLCLASDRRIVPSDLAADGLPDCVLVDEAQFLTEEQVDDLRILTIDPGVPVICYGLRTDSNGIAFPGSLRLLETADTIEEVKTICSRETCGRKAVMTLRTNGTGGPVFGAAQVEIGAAQYSAVCWEHWYDEVRSQIPNYRISARMIQPELCDHDGPSASSIRERIAALEAARSSRSELDELIRYISQRSGVPECTILSIRGCMMDGSRDERTRLDAAITTILDTEEPAPDPDVCCNSDGDYWTHTGTCE